METKAVSRETDHAAVHPIPGPGMVGSEENIAAHRTTPGSPRRPVMHCSFADLRPALILLPLLAACAGGDTDAHDTDHVHDTDDAGLEIAGAWVDDFGGTHDISETTWDMAFALFAITGYDNDGDWLVARNDAENDFAPGLWSRMDWTHDGTDHWFCQTLFDATSEQAAREVPRADDTDPATGGCGGFPWSMLTPR